MGALCHWQKTMEKRFLLWKHIYWKSFIAFISRMLKRSSIFILIHGWEELRICWVFSTRFKRKRFIQESFLHHLTDLVDSPQGLVRPLHWSDEGDQRRAFRAPSRPSGVRRSRSRRRQRAGWGPGPGLGLDTAAHLRPSDWRGPIRVPDLHEPQEEQDLQAQRNRWVCCVKLGRTYSSVTLVKIISIFWKLGLTNI